MDVIFYASLVIPVAFAAIYIFRIEAKYISNIEGFAQARNMSEPGDYFFMDHDEVKCLYRREDKLEISYRRQMETASNYVDSTRFHDVSASDSYASHWLLLELPDRESADMEALLSAIKSKASDLKWNWVERKLDGRIIVSRNANGIQLHIALPLHSNGLWQRIKSLLDDSIAAWEQS